MGGRDDGTARRGPYGLISPLFSHRFGKGHKTRNEGLNLSCDGFVGQFSFGVEQVTCVRNQQSSGKPRLGAQGAQHRQPGVLAQDRAKTAGRRADDGNRLAAENMRDV